MSGKHNKTSDRNKHIIGKSTARKGMSTSKVSTQKDRIDIRIPKTSKIYQYLYVDNTIIKAPKYKLLDAIISQLERIREDQTVPIVDKFIESIGELYPDKTDKLNKLRPLIIKRILHNDELDESYYKMLREL